jgi:hypothetical protein
MPKTRGEVDVLRGSSLITRSQATLTGVTVTVPPIGTKDPEAKVVETFGV